MDAKHKPDLAAFAAELRGVTTPARRSEIMAALIAIEISGSAVAEIFEEAMMLDDAIYHLSDEGDGPAEAAALLEQIAAPPEK